MKELPIDISSQIDGVSCSNCFFKHEAAELEGTGKMLCAEPP